QRTRGLLLKQLANAFGNEAECVDRIPNLGFVGGNLSIEHVTRDAILVLVFFRSSIGIVAGDRDQHDGKALRQKLSQAGPVQWVQEKLVPVRRTAVDDRKRGESRFGFVGDEVKSGDVPVETVIPV